tara:strand:+ start:5059 stop:5310 length:252 start_codon:yes stop_codon:yes gene_type:complete
MWLLDLFIGAIIFLILRWLFFKLLKEYHEHILVQKQKIVPKQEVNLDDLHKKAESNSLEREEIRGVAEQTQEKLINIKSKLEK